MKPVVRGVKMMQSEVISFLPINFLENRQFQVAVSFQDSILMDRIFKVFDADDDGNITFDEFVACLSTMSNKAKPEDKLKCECARLHD
jgi:hypothetical protein